MGPVSQPKSDRLGYLLPSLSIYLCNLLCESGVPTNSLEVRETQSCRV